MVRLLSTTASCFLLLSLLLCSTCIYNGVTGSSRLLMFVINKGLSPICCLCAGVKQSGVNLMFWYKSRIIQSNAYGSIIIILMDKNCLCLFVFRSLLFSAGDGKRGNSRHGVVSKLLLCEECWTGSWQVSMSKPNISSGNELPIVFVEITCSGVCNFCRRCCFSCHFLIHQRKYCPTSKST